MNTNYQFLSCKRVLLFFFCFMMSSALFAQFFYNETFRNTTGMFIPGGNAPGYTAQCCGDAPGDGWLRITNTSTNQRGYVKFDGTFPSSMGVTIEFDFKVWGPVSGQKADGFSVFLFNGSYLSQFAIGAIGGDLGYGNQNGPGLAYAYLGVGIDEYGNFANHGSNDSPAPTTRPSSIGVRDGNYYWIDGTPADLGMNIKLEHTPYSTTRPADNVYYRRARVDIEPNGTGGMKVNVYLRTTVNGVWQHILTNVQVTNPVPAIFGMGFAGTTGGSVAYHEVRDMIARTPGDLYVKIPDTLCRSISLGDTTTIAMHVVNGLGTAENIYVCDTLPADFILIEHALSIINSNGTASFSGFTESTLPDGRHLYCYYLNMSSYGEVAMTYSGQFSSIPTFFTVGSTLTPPQGNFGDLNPNDNQLSVTIPLVRYDTVSAEICTGQSYDFNGILYSDSGFYTQTYTGINGCDSLITLHLKLNPCEVYDTISQVICEGTTYDFNGEILTEQNTYTDTLLTTYGGDSIITLYLSVNPVYHISLNDVVCTGKAYHKHGFNLAAHDSAGSYTYERLLQTVNGCDSIITLTLQVPEVTVAISSSNPDFCNTYETTLSAITPNSKVQWNTGATSTDISVTHSGSYSVTAYENDCTAFAAYAVEECPIAIVFPNAITPLNTDGINDYFYLPAADAVYEFSLFIYDRWGECVFTSTDSRFRWNGTVKGKITQGVYTYVVTYRADNDRKSRSTKGTVTVY